MKFVRVKGSANSHLYKRGDHYWVRGRFEKRLLQKSLGTNNLTDARIFRDKEIAIFLGRKPKNSGVSLLGEKFDEWIEINKVKWSIGTTESVTNQWTNHLKPFFEKELISDVNDTAWLKYVSDKRKTDLKRKFFNDRKYLSMFLNWAFREGLIEKLPKLSDVDPEVKAGRVYSSDELEALLQASDNDLAIQIVLALTMGMRVGEILSLEWRQVDFKRKLIHLPAAKTKIRKERTFAISEDALPLLISRHERSRSDWVFPSPKDSTKSVGKGGNKSAWKSAKKKAGVVGRFHDLRHTFLTNAFRSGANPALICYYAGVSLEEAQKTYLHFTPEDTYQLTKVVRST